MKSTWQHCFELGYTESWDARQMTVVKQVCRRLNAYEDKGSPWLSARASVGADGSDGRSSLKLVL